jgi:hypothetical protein
MQAELALDQQCGLRVRAVSEKCHGEKALDMLQTMDIGQDGSMSTIHAQPARGADPSRKYDRHGRHQSAFPADSWYSRLIVHLGVGFVA